MIKAGVSDGDRRACELDAEMGNWLGVGKANLAAGLDAGTFVIGGGLSAAGDLLLSSARETCTRQLTGRGYPPEARIVAAERGNDAGLNGSGDLAGQEVGSQAGGRPSGSGKGPSSARESPRGSGGRRG